MFKKFRDLLKKRSPLVQTEQGLLESADFKRLVVENYLALSEQIFERQAENLLHQTASLYSPGSDSPFEELRVRTMRKKTDLLKVKMILDYVTTQKPDLGEVAMFHIRDLEREYWREVKRNEFKEPFQFTLNVPLSQWSRYKTQYLPKPRFLGGIAKTLDEKSTFRLKRRDTRPPKKVSRPRGYKDKGNLASQDSTARRKADREAEQIKQFLQQVKRRHSYNSRRISDQQEAKRQTLREVKKRMNLPKNTTLLAVEQHLNNLHRRISG